MTLPSFCLLCRYAVPPEHGKRLERLAQGKSLTVVAHIVVENAWTVQHGEGGAQCRTTMSLVPVGSNCNPDCRVFVSITSMCRAASQRTCKQFAHSHVHNCRIATYFLWFPVMGNTWFHWVRVAVIFSPQIWCCTTFAPAISFTYWLIMYDPVCVMVQKKRILCWSFIITYNF